MKWTVSLVAVALFGVVPARAADACKSACDAQNASCKKECAGESECLADCVEGQKLCPKLCAASQRGGGDPQKMQREIEKVLRAHEAEEAKKAGADAEGHGHEHRDTKSNSSSY
jgi:hypothetical protein